MTRHWLRAASGIFSSMQGACVTDAGRLLLRPWKDSAFRVLALALFVAALSLTTVLLLRADLEQRFDRRTAEMLGGDLVLDGSRAPEPAQATLLAPLETSTVVKFSSVLVWQEQILLVGIKAVDDTWPLYGRAFIAAGRFAAENAVDHGPSPGEAWVADQVLDRLGLRVGDEVQVGDVPLKVTAVIRQEPDQGAGFYSMTPRVLMHRDDLAAAGVLGQGSRVSHDVLIRTSAPAELARNLTPTLRPDQELEQVADSQARGLGPLRQLTLWISLGVILIALLCGAAIYLTTGLRVARRARLAALLRTFGASRQAVLRRLLGGELTAVLPPVAAGIASGYVLYLLGRYLLAWQTPMAAGPLHWLAVLAAPLGLFAAFALPRLLGLVRVPAIDVLNRGTGDSLRRSGLELAAALVAPVLLAALLLGSLRQLVQLLVLLAGLGAILPLLLWPLLKGLDKASERWPVARRLAIRRLSRRPTTTLPLLAALSLAMAILTLAGLSGTELLSDWRRKLPQMAPNHFLLNLFDADREVLARWQAQVGARAEPLYPIVRGRLTSINGEPVRAAVTKESDRAERALNRDLALTESDKLPDSNHILAGTWHGSATDEVSVESELAESLQLSVGDRLGFVTSRGTLEATVSSIREVDWESFAPNFYFMFSSGSFIGQDITWLTSFWLPPGDGQRLARLMEYLPHITLLDVNSLLDQAQEVVTQASRATALLASLLVAASLLVLTAALLATGSQRRADQALLRALGARRALLGAINRVEFIALGLTAAAVAMVLVLAALVPLSILLFDGKLPWSSWLWLPAVLGIGVALCGLLAVRGQEGSPGELLREP